MLDKYESDQMIAYKTLLNGHKNKRNSHAYLFETNGYKYSNEFILAFAKFLLCPNNYSNEKHCKDCIQCQKIDDDSFGEIKILKSDGMLIKKEQLIDLQKDFSKKALIGDKKIYIIQEAEKMNLQTSNSILKFLEEPEEGIYAFIVVNNRYQMIETIISRCQIISFSKQKDKENTSETENIRGLLTDNQNEKIDSLKISSYLSEIKKFIKDIENKNEDIFLKTSKYMKTIFNDKETIILSLDIIRYYYFDVFNVKMDREAEIFIDDITELKLIGFENKVEELSYKINVMIDTVLKAKANLNNALLIDKMLFKIKEYKND